MSNKKPKVLVLGWDAADWKFINPLLDSGKMPALQQLIDGGSMGNILTLDPPLSPILWTSIATGKYGDDHGILSFVEPDPNTGKRRPISIHSRKVRTIWNILTHHGYKTHVFGWWPSYPAEPINGVQLSNHFSDVQQNSSMDSWELNPMHVHPKERLEEFKSLRVHPTELTWAHIGPFVPNATKESLEKEENKVLFNEILLLLSNCACYHNAATHVMENEEWDFLGLYFDAIDKASHKFMKFHPPQQAHVSDEEYSLFKDVMEGFYIYHDMMLGRLLELIDDSTHIVLLSDHGFYSDHRRLETLPKDSMAPAYEHSPFGILTLYGPQIKKDQRIYGSSLIDITPTILHLFGLPAAEDMPGKVLSQAFENYQEIQRIPTYEGPFDGTWGEINPDEKTDVWSAQEALEQLIALGYVAALDETDEKLIDQMAFENKYHEARIKQGKGDIENAIVLLNELVEQEPRAVKVIFRLVNAYIETKNNEAARVNLNKLRAMFGSKNTPQIDVLEAKILIQEFQPKQALKMLKKASKSKNVTAEILLVLGKNLSLLRDWKEAIAVFKKVIELDTENAAAYHGLCIAYMRSNDLQNAIEAGITAVGIRFWFPNAHYHLGEALLKADYLEHAVNAFEIALDQQPGFALARKHLIALYAKLNNPERKAFHETILKTKMRPKITIVSGLPRSGTSMMMQMLAAGGADILTDNLRESDTNNPKGYLEYEPVKGLMKDNTWLLDQNGKTIKVILQLLPSLNPACDYKIVFMERDLDEVLTSQSIMLGKQNNDTFNATLKTTFQQQKEQNKNWLASQANMEVVYVNYADVVNNPTQEIERICLFLEDDLNKAAMKKAVDASLYRNKKG